MSEQRDHTTERIDSSRNEHERSEKRRSYYYDDSTGYEIYDPAKEDDEAEEKESVEEKEDANG